MPIVAVNDIEMYYESHGTGDPLVLVGGLGLDVSELTRLSTPLAERFQVVMADNRGVGRSSKPPGPYSIDQMADDLATLLATLEVTRTAVLGISMGGRIAMSLALTRPSLVERLVLVSTGPRPGEHRRSLLLSMRLANLPGLRGRYPQPHDAMQAQFDATSRFDCTDRLSEIACPTLIVHGRADRRSPFSQAEEMAELIPDSRLVTLKGGHFVAFANERWKVRTAVEDFLGVPLP